MRSLKELQSTEFCFQSLSRSEVWTAKYVSKLPNNRESVLELVIDRPGMQWSLYAPLSPPKAAQKTDSEEEIKLVGFMGRPVARMIVPTEARSVIEGEWEVCLPVTVARELSIRGDGNKTETWESRLGLKGKFEGSERFEKLIVEGDTQLSSPLRLLTLLSPRLLSPRLLSPLCCLSLCCLSLCCLSLCCLLLLCCLLPYCLLSVVSHSAVSSSAVSCPTVSSLLFLTLLSPALLSPLCCFSLCCLYV